MTMQNYWKRRRRLLAFRRGILRVTRNEHLVMMVLSIATGLLAGLGAAAVRYLILAVQQAGYGSVGSLVDAARSLPYWKVLLIPAVGGAMVGPITWWFARDAKGHGVPEVMLAVLLRGGRIRARVAVVKAVISAITIGTGGSAGREGPMVQIGAGLGSTIGQWFNLKERGVKTLVGAGAAGGLAAAFNAPIAGALFAMEVILGDFGIAAFSPLVISAVSATLVSRALGGHAVVFDVPAFDLVSVWEFIPYTLLGLLAGGVALAFIWFLYWQENLWEKLPLHEAVKPALGGLVIGSLALFFPQILGIGFDVVNDAMHNHLPWLLLLMLVFLKLGATSVTLASGGSGGVFVPSMFVGAMLGGVVGKAAAILMPDLGISPGAYVLVGMGALVAGTAQAPITAVLMAFELSGDYRIILPLMVTSIIACLMTQSIKRESIYTQKLLWKGISLKEGREEGVLKSSRVRRVLSKDYLMFNPHDTVDRIFSKALATRRETFPVVDSDGRLKGILRFTDLKALVEDRQTLSGILVAADLALAPIFVSPEENLQEVLNLLSLHDMGGIPVVTGGSVVGMVYEKDILDLYAREVRKLDLANAVAARSSFRVDMEGVELGEGYRLDTISVPEKLVGVSLLKSGLREEYGVEVLFIKRVGDEKRVFPQPDLELQKGDELVVMGTAEGVRRLKGEPVGKR